jgi:hypothetical protein
VQGLPSSITPNIGQVPAIFTFKPKRYASTKKIMFTPRLSIPHERAAWKELGSIIDEVFLPRIFQSRFPGNSRKNGFYVSRENLPGIPGIRFYLRKKNTISYFLIFSDLFSKLFPGILRK